MYYLFLISNLFIYLFIYDYTFKYTNIEQILTQSMIYYHIYVLCTKKKRLISIELLWYYNYDYFRLNYYGIIIMIHYFSNKNKPAPLLNP